MDRSNQRTVDFSDEAYQQLKALARKMGKTIADVLKEAIELDIVLDEARSEGGRVIIEKGGKYFEVGKRKSSVQDWRSSLFLFS